ncbi:MAG TPA: hypothetical protein VN841_03660 [Bryobacteraceae bacterium]|nr:hypothetical protein [Bryobacteraceae bacterium]
MRIEPLLRFVLLSMCNVALVALAAVSLLARHPYATGISLSLLLALMLGMFDGHKINALETRGSFPADDREYWETKELINQIEIEKLLVEGKGQAYPGRFVEVDKQLARLRARLQLLEPAHAAVERRKEERAEEEARQKLENIVKRCEALKEKRVVDLTVNDAEFLREQCNVSRIP